MPISLRCVHVQIAIYSIIYNIRIRNIYIYVHDICSLSAETFIGNLSLYNLTVPRYCVEHGTLAPELHSHTVKKYVRLLKKVRLWSSTGTGSWRQACAKSPGSFPNDFFQSVHQVTIGNIARSKSSFAKLRCIFSKYIGCDLTSVLRRMQPGEKQLTCQGVIAPAKKRHHLPKAAWEAALDSLRWGKDASLGCKDSI